MRTLLLSDIHANLAALKAVLAAADQAGGIDSCWVMGDIAGYGPQPNECLETVRERATAAVAGNHDLAAIGRLDTSDFNEAAAQAAQWTSRQLTPDSREFAAGLPLRAEQDGHTIVHGSPRDPVWEYLIAPVQAVANLEHFDTPGCTFGHTHVPMLMQVSPSSVYVTPPADGQTVPIEAERWYVNPGSVGQPRDRDPRAAWAMLDTGQMTVTFHRTPYDVSATQALMEVAGLPPWLIYRLSHGV